MPEQEQVNKAASVNAGSDVLPSASDPSVGGESERESGTQGDESQGEVISKEVYEKALKQLEDANSFIGSQSEQIGEYRSFYGKIEPLMERLRDNPEVVQAILEDKLDADLAKAVLDGKVSVKEAERVTSAHREVKKDLGKERYMNTSPEDIEKLVSEKVEKIVSEKTGKLEHEIGEIEKRRDFENAVMKFVEGTPDFDQYSEKIAEWLNENPKQYDIRVAYEAVKGRETIEKSRDSEKKRMAEESKNLAANASGGRGSQTGTIDEANLTDQLIKVRSNPNLF